MHTRLFLILTLLLTFGSAILQAQTIDRYLYDNYERYRDNSINNKYYRHKDLLRLISRIKSEGRYEVSLEGHSIEGRSIYLIRLGQGKHRVFAWSQMHGDESTATMALSDLLNFFSSDDELNDLRRKILGGITLYFLPMLNPDGAERFQRRNAADIDLNRDAARLQCPESRLLKKLRDRIQPEFGFNLHDQSPRYSSGESYRWATLSFLAPPFDSSRSLNPVRQKAMQVIALMNDAMQNHIPGHTGKYSDEFEPRAFGDNMQRWGTSTILIESGGWPGDPQKQFVRKLNFIALLTAFNSIATDSYSDVNVGRYYNIPDNEKYLFDLILRNVKFEYQGGKYTIDIAINRYEEVADGTIFIRSAVEDAGDLSVFYGLEELDCSELQVEPGRIYPRLFSSYQEILNADHEQLLKDGYTSLCLKDDAIRDEMPAKNYTPLPFTICPGTKLQGRKFNSNESSGRIFPVSARPDYIIRNNGAAEYAIVNGFIYDLKTSTSNVINGIVE